MSGGGEDAYNRVKSGETQLKEVRLFSLERNKQYRLKVTTITFFQSLKVFKSPKNKKQILLFGPKGRAKTCLCVHWGGAAIAGEPTLLSGFCSKGKIQFLGGLFKVKLENTVCYEQHIHYKQ